MKRAISLLLVIVMTTIALAGCDSKSENPAGNANSKQPTDESITIKDSPDKYTWYIKNYVGKNCASIGYTSMSGDRMDHYGAGYIELVMVTPDGAFTISGMSRWNKSSQWRSAILQISLPATSHSFYK